MNSTIFQILVVILSGAVLVILIWNIAIQISLVRIKRNLRIMFSGKKAASLEEIILGLKIKTESLDNDVKDLYDISSKIHQLAHKGVHKVGVVRFNPFRDIGGDQSFSVALLDGDNNGLVISSLYSRDGVRVYTKALAHGASEKYPLTEEEKSAITRATIHKRDDQMNRRG